MTSSGEAAAAELRQPETPDSFAAVMRQRYDALKAGDVGSLPVLVFMVADSFPPLRHRLPGPEPRGGGPGNLDSEWSQPTRPPR